jgi:hypothetical protein
MDSSAVVVTLEESKRGVDGKRLNWPAILALVFCLLLCLLFWGAVVLGLRAIL